MSTLSTTQQLLKELKKIPNKRLGQNFLVDKNIISKSLSLTPLQAGETIVEIGPGLGALTKLLLEKGLNVYAIEKDSTFYQFLKTTLGAHYPKTFHLLLGDAIDFPLAGLPVTETNYKIIANLPFNISTPWMQKALQGPLPSELILFLQLEAAERFMAVPGTSNGGAISLFIAGAFDVVSKHKVGAHAFYPKPAVDSMVLHLRKKQKPFCFHEKTQVIIRNIFNYRRKQIQGIIRTMLKDHPELRLWLDNLEKNGRPLTIRPEAIPFNFWKDLDVIIKTKLNEP